MTIPDEHRAFFAQIIAAGAAGRLALVEVQVNATGAWATAFVIVGDRDDAGQCDILPFALLDPDLMETVTPAEHVQEVYYGADTES